MELPMNNLIARFVKDQSGATAIEYGLIAAGISLAIITVVNGLGSNLNTKFTSINTSLKKPDADGRAAKALGNPGPLPFFAERNSRKMRRPEAPRRDVRQGSPARR